VNKKKRHILRKTKTQKEGGENLRGRKKNKHSLGKRPPFMKICQFTSQDQNRKREERVSPVAQGEIFRQKKNGHKLLGNRFGMGGGSVFQKEKRPFRRHNQHG